MLCKRQIQCCEKCMCLKRRHDGSCEDCEKNAIKAVYNYGRNLNELITEVKESGKGIRELYVKVNGLDGDPGLWWRSAIDILRGVCKYCKNVSSSACKECMWTSETNSEDHWVFDEDSVRYPVR